jgi:hypothetical protein
MDNLVKIKNLTRAAKHLGKDIAKQRKIPLGKFKEYITVNEVKNIIKQFGLQDEDGSILINYKILHKICEEINVWVLGIELSKLAALDSIETYWDDERNCMVFSYKKD